MSSHQGYHRKLPGILLACAFAMLQACSNGDATDAVTDSRQPVTRENAGPATAELPNVIIIVADDLGWSDLPAYGNTRHLAPNIDRLAREGVRLTDYYAYPVCTPSRVALMTGQNPARHRMTAVIPESFFPYSKLIQPRLEDRLPGDAPALGRLMQRAGYATAYYGKWHLGGPRGLGAPDFGYDDSLLALGLSHEAGGFKTGPETELPEGAWLGDVITDRAIEFMTQHKAQRFHVEIHHLSPHIPLQPKEETLAGTRERFARDGHAGNELYAAMIEDMDATIGRLLEALDELALSDRTLVMFMSDNGGLLQETISNKLLTWMLSLDTGPITTNTPLRYGKGSVYEGGIRVPFVARWPAMIPAGSETGTMASMMDIRATLADLVGSLTGDTALQDGSSFLKDLTEPGSETERPPLFIHFPHYKTMQPASTVRKDQWKLIHFYDTGLHELYNLEGDPGETSNLAEQESEITRELNRIMRDRIRETGAELPTPNPDHDPEREGKRNIVKTLPKMFGMFREFARVPEHE